MILEDIDKNNCPEIVIYGLAEKLICKFCKQEYVSRGKYDPGYCRECEKFFDVNKED